MPMGTDVDEVNDTDTEPQAQNVQFTAEDAADLAELRRQRQEAADYAAAEEEKNKIVPSHRLFLDNGDVIESQGVMTHFKGHAVLNSASITEDEV